MSTEDWRKLVRVAEEFYPEWIKLKLRHSATSKAIYDQ